MKVYVKAVDPAAQDIVKALLDSRLHVVDVITDQHDLIIVDENHATTIPMRRRHKAVVYSENKNASAGEAQSLVTTYIGRMKFRGVIWLLSSIKPTLEAFID